MTECGKGTRGKVGKLGGKMLLSAGKEEGRSRKIGEEEVGKLGRKM